MSAPLRLGTATLSSEAMVSIVRGALAGVEGARLEAPGRVSRVLPGRREAVEWTLGAGALDLDVNISAVFGSVLPAVAEEARTAIAEAVSGMTGLDVRAVSVTVTGLDRTEGER